MGEGVWMSVWVPFHDELAAEGKTYDRSEPPLSSDTYWFKMWKWVFGQARVSCAKKSLLGWWLKGWIVRIYLMVRLCQLLGVNAHLGVWVHPCSLDSGPICSRNMAASQEATLKGCFLILMAPCVEISVVCNSNISCSQIFKEECLEIGLIRWVQVKYQGVTMLTINRQHKWLVKQKFPCELWYPPITYSFIQGWLISQW